MPPRKKQRPRTVWVRVLKSFDQFREGDVVEVELTEWVAHLIADFYFEELP